jgi:UDP-N-acetylmuramyl tripeptide synthase
MVVELLEAAGKRVLTNPTGSNFTRGIVSSLVRQAKLSGRLSYDIGVFELDEAYAKLFVQQVKPRWVLALNVMRDQLDRFGEVDTTAKLINSTMTAASDGVVTNADDRQLVGFAQKLAGSGKKVVYFGVAADLRQFFPTDEEIVAVSEQPAQQMSKVPREVELVKFESSRAVYKVAGHEHALDLKISGQHNLQNAAAAVTLALNLLPERKVSLVLADLAQIDPAFGRGQAFAMPDGSVLKLLLVKNPAGFRQTLASYPVADAAVMIAINDDFADGRDVSWLWDVDFSVLAGKTVELTSGTRAADTALRLSYDEVTTARVEPDLTKALTEFRQLPGEKLLIATYTAMTKLHKALGGKL